MHWGSKTLIGFVAVLAVVNDARANDSSAALGLGGLTLTRNDAVSLDSEDLYISPRRVTVSYVFTNHSDKPVTTLVAFPLPQVPAGGEDAYFGDAPIPNWRDFAFTTRVEGQDVALTRVDSAVLKNGRDVTADIKALGWPLRWYEDDAFASRIERLSGAQIKTLLTQGLIVQAGGAGHYRPAWQVATSITRMQTFPAHASIKVVHSYAPVVGTSVAGAIEPQYRKGDVLKAYQKGYCTDAAFFSAFDRSVAADRKATGEKNAAFYEVYVSYLLKPGANWRGPIKQFRLVVDKLHPLNLVSFCSSGVRKISPTQFEVRRRNFEPDRDLDVLFVGWPRRGGALLE